MQTLPENNNASSGYSTPSNFFEEKRRELQAIPESSKNTGGKLRYLPSFGIVSGIAAAVLLGLFIMKGPTEVNPHDLNVPHEELADYILTTYDYETSEKLLLQEFEDLDLPVDQPNLNIDNAELELLLESGFDQTLNYEYL